MMNVTDLDIILHLRSLLQAAALNGEALNRSLARVRGLIRQRFGVDALRPLDDEMLRTGFDLAAVRNLIADAATLARVLAEHQQPDGQDCVAAPTRSLSAAAELARALRAGDQV